MASRYAVVDVATRRIENMIIAEVDFTLPDKELVLVSSKPEMRMGGTLVNGVFNPEPPHIDTPTEANTKLVNAKLAAGLAEMQQIIDAAAPFSAAAATTAIKAQARLIRSILRYIQSSYDAAD